MLRIEDNFWGRRTIPQVRASLSFFAENNIVVAGAYLREIILAATVRLHFSETGNHAVDPRQVNALMVAVEENDVILIFVHRRV